ncbi:DUF3881 family protein [Parablautia sp. Marseille-Q6255]|uniref:DUF3881 family protein n=1 Tax=Parablautia sp. Marseille-Q6255 TaxID=3039593 RepID=UPI0024BC0B87|nr:DUF3881 family protein [Parablautia sp. Marseille-Q6255]
MHSYLRAIGFSKLNKEYDAEKLLDEVYKNYDHKIVAKAEKYAHIELEKEFAPDMGIILCGDIDEKGFHKKYYFPYFRGNTGTVSEDVIIEKRVNGESYSGVCDDGRVGVSLIFYLQNPTQYQREQFVSQMFGRKLTATFSCLSTNGMILLPVRKNTEQLDLQKSKASKRSQLLNAAKDGDQEAIESLTIEDMDLYSMISRRVCREDIYTIVDTFFMPYGIECDQYQVMGNINSCTKVQNIVTGENIYRLTIECNDMIFDVCINETDLTGEPEAGRRFKGTVWLQGKVNFE